MSFMRTCKASLLTWLIRYARVDRRPLDPPPVIHLRIFRVQRMSSGEEFEIEMDYK